MKLFHYYIAILAPWTIGLYFLYMHYGYLFFGFLMTYFVYRCILDYHKLKAQGVVGKKDAWRFVFSGHTITYFKELYFKQ